MNSIKCSDSDVVLFSSWCLCEMIWQSRCCRNNAFLCLPSPVMNVLGSSRDFLPNADSANRRSGGFRGAPETEGIKRSSGSPASCAMHTERCSCEGLCSAFSLVLAKAAGWVAQVSQAMSPSPGVVGAGEAQRTRVAE